MKNLVIKFGAPGDTLRTTPILRVLGGDITWLTEQESLPVLRSSCISKKVAIEDEAAVEQLMKDSFDVVYSLEEDMRAAQLAGRIHANELRGFYEQDDRLCSTDPDWGWIGLVPTSPDGRPVNVQGKRQNRQSYQKLIFDIIGVPFTGQDYVIEWERKREWETPPMVGITTEVGRKWPTKQYLHTTQLADELRKKGYAIRLFEQRQTMEEHIGDVNACDMVVAADSLPMHIALALGKPTVAYFGPTSAAEIYDYGDRLLKVVTDLPCARCYAPICDVSGTAKAICMDELPVSTLAEAVDTQFRRYNG